jgi:acyl-CoA thioester hydrolase
MGVAYHANYFVWFELARTELMRDLGCPYRELEDREDVFFPVIRAGARYLAPARYDDQLEVQVRLASVSGARVRFEYRVIGPDGGITLATGFTEHAAVGENGRPKRLPAALKERLLVIHERP